MGPIGVNQCSNAHSLNEIDQNLKQAQEFNSAQARTGLWCFCMTDLCPTNIKFLNENQLLNAASSFNATILLYMQLMY